MYFDQRKFLQSIISVIFPKATKRRKNIKSCYVSLEILTDRFALLQYRLEQNSWSYQK